MAGLAVPIVAASGVPCQAGLAEFRLTHILPRASADAETEETAGQAVQNMETTAADVAVWGTVVHVEQKQNMETTAAGVDKVVVVVVVAAEKLVVGGKPGASPSERLGCCHRTPVATGTQLKKERQAQEDAALRLYVCTCCTRDIGLGGAGCAPPPQGVEVTEAGQMSGLQPCTCLSLTYAQTS